MTILFVCRANIGRSQVAEAFYNLRCPGQANSAGTLVDLPGQTLQDREGAENVIDAMLERNIDISKKIRNQIVESDVNKYDKVVVMAERETIPDWLKDKHNVLFWDVEDPKEKDLITTRRIVKEIENKVAQL